MTEPLGKKKRCETIITTHLNADFDAMASLLAAQKLYPDALVVFPGSQEKNLRNFFVQSMAYLYNLVEVKEIDFDEVKKLILVDTRQANRIGKLADLIEKPGIEIITFDHHPEKIDDIKGNLNVHALTGATITILTELIEKKNIHISSDEATMMCLGLYEDTGSFTFSSTTEKDFRAAAYLLSKGANLNIISNLISREITPEQISLLNEMIQASVYHNIGGINIVFTRINIDRYIPDFAFLVHKLVRMENISAIFALAQMENKVYVVARSKIPEVDTGAIVSELNGGGHTYAASVTIKGITLHQAEQQLLTLCYQHVRSKRLAMHIMSSPPITVDAETSCHNARMLLTRYNINALLVTQKTDEKKENHLCGYITRQVIEKAVYHKIGHLPVKEYMSRGVITTSPHADLNEIQEKIFESKQRILPVIENDTAVGVVTRTDLLNILLQQNHSVEPIPNRIRESINARTRNISHLMKERLSERILETLKIIGEVAEEHQNSAYVIGGFVRDLFLYRKNEDIDVVIEGDGIQFAKQFAEKMNARVHTHLKFGTAVIIFKDNFKIDVATARLEYYKSPAALPDVEMSSIKLDLFRRDFTINTLAIHLNPQKFGFLIDFFSAQKDIKDKVIRVLHNLSFVEDPTRVFRAIRFEQRFGFTTGKLTQSLIENAVRIDFFRRLSGRRIMTEIKLILEENNPIPAITRMNEYKLLRVIHPHIQLNQGKIELLHSVKQAIDWQELLFTDEPYEKWIVYFTAIIRSIDYKTTASIMTHLEINSPEREIFCRGRFQAENLLKHFEKTKKIRNSDIYNKLSNVKIEMILFMMAAASTEKVKKLISAFSTKLRHTTLSVSGKNLMELGIPPGPVYRTILHKTLEAKLNEKLKTPKDELLFVEKEAKKLNHSEN